LISEVREVWTYKYIVDMQKVALTKMSTRNLPGGKGRQARKADSLTAICELIVYKMWEAQHLTTQWASRVCYRYNFLYIFADELFLVIEVVYILPLQCFDMGRESRDVLHC
jgi:hypothetical protein